MHGLLLLVFADIIIALQNVKVNGNHLLKFIRYPIVSLSMPDCFLTDFCLLAEEATRKLRGGPH